MPLASTLFLLSAGLAHAAEPSQIDLHGGFNVRSDIGVHPIRLTAGAGLGDLGLDLVVDPIFFTDGQVHTDLTADWGFDSGIGPLLGWRVNAINLGESTQLQHNLLVGLDADLPRLWDERIRGTFGFEADASTSTS